MLTPLSKSTHRFSNPPLLHKNFTHLPFLPFLAKFMPPLPKKSGGYYENEDQCTQVTLAKGAPSLMMDNC